MPDQPVEIRFGSAPTGILTISVRGRAYKHRRDSWDGNWLLVDVTVQLPRFTAKVPGMLRAEELHILSRELYQFTEALRATVEFSTHEAWLEFQIQAEANHRVTLSGTVSDPDNSASYLTFVIPMEQSSFAAQMTVLQRATAAFPVIDIT